ncbi:DUF1318 domain-containing protein [Sphingomonas ginkgonis]|uniref:DUF1318 domain-containing protein n=1 Tax=Sphingomonas ginkgonis TaxID=2315330 RepID=A0A3R9Y7L9_9SPHN|nr:YdbL family protein [Sphingomonas ginkgonis]RST31890.1 DUF1318 domain-containing protein [Sphingomonas ginkgonis]
MRRALLLAAGAVALLAGPAPAQNSPVIAAARLAGQVGERYDGFLGTVQPQGGIVRSATDGVNIRRRTLYARFAAQRGVSPAEVGITAGCTLLARVQVGEAYLLSDNVWRRRQPGESAPVPSYCTGG